MIRVEIIADRLRTANDVAGLLASDDSIELVEASELDTVPHRAGSSVDVLLAIRIMASQLASESCPVVLLSAEPAPKSQPALPPIRAWLPLNSSPTEISAAILAAAAGLFTQTADQFRRFQSTATLPDDTPWIEVEKLTSRELEVLNLMADGLGNKQIAEALKISDHTAKFHVAQVLGKLDASTRTEAVRIGIRRGLVCL